MEDLKCPKCGSSKYTLKQPTEGILRIICDSCGLNNGKEKTIKDKDLAELYAKTSSNIYNRYRYFS
ncbi:MAG TPA: hypothetical protein EYQ51_06045 [Alphaproteobacteria bacterium]|nr:hypothetical protein [Alphaproteobacteria bacterium]